MCALADIVRRAADERSSCAGFEEGNDEADINQAVLFLFPLRMWTVDESAGIPSAKWKTLMFGEAGVSRGALEYKHNDPFHWSSQETIYSETLQRVVVTVHLTMLYVSQGKLDKYSGAQMDG